MSKEPTEGAPIIYLFGAPSGRSLSEGEARVKAQLPPEPAPVATPVREALVSSASESLVRKLSRKQLSSREAHDFLLNFLTDPELETPLDRYEALEIADQIVADFEQRLYLNDAGLAEVLIESLQQRKAVGRSVLARELTMRGIPRDLIDEALSTLDRDEEAERALEFARDRARKLGSNVDEEAALRRLFGQLARRGYPANLAQTAARTALRELRGPANTARGRVTFS